MQMLVPRFPALEVLFGLYLLHSCHAYPRGTEGDASGMEDLNRSGDPMCSVDLEQNAPRHLPLFLSRATGEFLMPHPEIVDGKVKRILSLEGVNSSDIVALCPGTRLMTTDVVSSSVTCMESTDKTFEMGNSGDAVTFEEMSCEESIQEVIKSTDEECGPDDNPGKLMHIGWEDGGAFHHQISLCHVGDQEHTHYANHTVYGVSIRANKKREPPPTVPTR